MAKLLEVADVSAPGGEPVRQLKQDAAELARFGERRQRLRLHLPDQLIHVLRHVAQVDADFVGDGCWQKLLDRRREPLDDYRVMRDDYRVIREQAEGFDVEHEAG